MRFTQQLLTRTIRYAGYKTSPNSITADIFTPANPALFAVDGANNASDTLTVRFEGSGPTAGTADGSVIDCLGNAVAARTLAEDLHRMRLVLQCWVTCPAVVKLEIG